MMKHATLCNAVVELGACPRASRTYPAKPLLRGRGVGVCELILLESHALLTSCLLWHAVMVHPPCSLRLTVPHPLIEYACVKHMTQ